MAGLHFLDSSTGSRPEQQASPAAAADPVQAGRCQPAHCPLFAVDHLTLRCRGSFDSRFARSAVGSIQCATPGCLLGTDFKHAILVRLICESLCDPHQTHTCRWGGSVACTVWCLAARRNAAFAPHLALHCMGHSADPSQRRCMSSRPLAHGWHVALLTFQPPSRLSFAPVSP